MSRDKRPKELTDLKALIEKINAESAAVAKAKKAPTDLNALFNQPAQPAPTSAPDADLTLAQEGIRFDLIEVEGEYPVLSTRIQLNPKNVAIGLGIIAAAAGAGLLYGYLSGEDEDKKKKKKK